MRETRICATLMLAALVCLSLVPSGGQASEDLLRIRSWRFLPLEEKPLRLCFKPDLSGGAKFRLKKQKVDGEKRRGLRITSTQDDGYGFVNTGNQLGLDWKLNATYAYHKDKGLRDGYTFAGLEVDYPYVPMGTIPSKYIFVGVTWHTDGLSTFVNDSGSTVGSQASYPGRESVDIEIRYLYDTEYTIKTRATGDMTWDTIYAGDPSVAIETPAGLGFGVNNLDDNGSVFLCGLEMEGEIFTGLKKSILDELQEAIDFQAEALEAEEHRRKSDVLGFAKSRLEAIILSLEDAYILGDIDIDYDKVMKALRKAVKNNEKAAEKVRPSKVVTSWGSKERKRVEKAINKSREAMDLIQKMEVFD
jgi:hypothetical protein